MTLTATPDLTGKLALVTGAGSGIGEQTAHALSQAGAKVIVTDITLARARSVGDAIGKAGGMAVAMELDVTDRQAITALANSVKGELGDIDLLINNAGILKRLPLDDDDVDDGWTEHMAINLEGPFRLTRAFLDSLERTQGNIVNVASINSFISFARTTPYVTSKGGIAHMTRTMAAELGPKNIRVNAVAPGVIATPMTADVRADAYRMGELMKRVPLARPGEPEEIATAILFLASDMASYISGAVLPVDGGTLSA